jgi:DUF2075 family protein
MLIYNASVEEFKDHIIDGVLTEIITDGFKARFGFSPSASEIRSWDHSLPKIKDIVDLAGLADNTIAIEYEVPYNNQRIDVLIFGKGLNNVQNVVLIELKGWKEVEMLDEEGNFLETAINGGRRRVPHPSQQAKGYQDYVLGFVSEFQKLPPFHFFSCAYCFNYSDKPDSGLRDIQYKQLLEEYPLYTREDARRLAVKIKDLLGNGGGFEIFNRFMQSPIKPSKKLLDNAKDVIKQKGLFSLLNEQLIAKNLIWARIRKEKKTKTKSVIIVHGGPGTGKSVIAVNILAEAAGKGLTVFYACKSKPFTSAFQHLIGTDARMLFSNLYRFVPNRVKEDEVDILLVDEAHRIEKTSNFQYTKAEDRTEMPQIDQLIRCSKVAVFFIDDRQNVRGSEIGNSNLIKAHALRHGRTVHEVQLETQFRCMGSNNYIEWLEAALGYNDTHKILQREEVFELKIFDTPTDLFNVLKEKENAKPNSARLVAGYCWPWSDPNSDGTLVNDVVIDEFKMPWEARDGFKLQKGIPKWFEWAYKKGGIEQVGCIYTAQGFEFDYIGVIIGRDILVDKKTGKLKTDITQTADPTLKKSSISFDANVRNIYRVLMSRGMKGCYIYCVDEDVKSYFKKRVEL